MQPITPVCPDCKIGMEAIYTLVGPTVLVCGNCGRTITSWSPEPEKETAKIP